MNLSQIAYSLEFYSKIVCLNTSETFMGISQEIFLMAQNKTAFESIQCVPYNKEYYQCLKWKLQFNECSVFDNGTVLYEPKPDMSFYFDIGMYNLSLDDDKVHVCVPPQLANFIKAADAIIIALWVLSMISLLFLICSCLMIPKQHAGVLCPLMFHAGSLFVRYVVHVVFQVQHQPSQTSCFIIAFVAHLSFMSTHSWLNVINYNMWRQFRVAGSHGDVDRYGWCKFFQQASYAWGAPAVIISISGVLQWIPSPILPGFKERCLIAYYETQLQVIFFFGGESVLVLINIFLVALSFYHLCQKIPQLLLVNKEIRQTIVYTNLKLVFLSGSSWLLLIVSRVTFPFGNNQDIMSFAIEVPTSLQGVFLLIVYASTSSNRKIVNQVLTCN